MSRTWLITGASSGFGRLLAERVASAGDHVIAVARRSGPLGDLAAKAPGRITPVVLDITDKEAGQIVKSAVDHADGLNVLVNNAGYGLMAPVEQTDDAAARSIFETNFFAGLTILQAALPALQASHGRVIQISSYLGQVVWPGAALYSATKAAVEAISAALAVELEPLGVSVTTIQPGIFRTEFRASVPMVEPNKLYANTVGTFLSELLALPESALGDPTLVVDAVMTAATHPKPPLRLAVGRDAVQGIRSALTKQLAEIAEWEPVSIGGAEK